jgi:hypothetical protein
MDFLTLLLIVLSVAGIIGIILGISINAKNKKHSKESKEVFDNLTDFKADNTYLSSSFGVSLGFDNERKKICFLDNMNRPYIYNYSKILQCELMVDEESILKQSTSSTIGRSIVGGVLGGGVGAIIGGTTGSRTAKSKIKTIDLKIIVNDPANPVFKVNFLNMETNKGSFLYNMTYSVAEQWHGIISGLIVQGNSEVSQTDNLSIADELKKLKELLDSDILTLDEFTKQKEKLLAGTEIKKMN